MALAFLRMAILNCRETGNLWMKINGINDKKPVQQKKASWQREITQMIGWTFGLFCGKIVLTLPKGKCVGRKRKWVEWQNWFAAAAEIHSS